MRALSPFLFLVVAVLVLLGGCHQHAATGGDKIYDVKGKVISVEPDKNTIKLDHEDIPGLMKAMTMNFKVEDPKLLEGLTPGDAVQGRLQVKSGAYVLTELRKQ